MNPSSSNVQCTFTSSGIALRGIPRQVISKSFINFKTGFWRLVPETHMMKVAYGGMVPRKYGLIGGDSRPNKCCCPMSPHGAGGPAKWSHDQSNGTRLTWKLRFKRIICSYVLPNLVFSAIHESFKRWSMVKLSLPIGKLRVVLVKFRAGWPLIADITSTSWVIHPQKGTIWANYIHWFPYWGWLGCIGIIPQYNELTLTGLVFILPELTWTKAILGSFPLTNRLLTVKLWVGQRVAGMFKLAQSQYDHQIRSKQIRSEKTSK